MNNLYIHTEKCRVESDYIKDLKYLVKAQKGILSMKRNFGYWVPMDLGQMRRGVDMGPSAIRYAGVIEKN